MVGKKPGPEEDGSDSPPAARSDYGKRSGMRTEQIEIAWTWDGEAVRIGAERTGAEPTLLLLPAMSSISTRAEMRPLAERLAPAFGRRSLEHEAALGTHRDDQGVLDHLGLHQAQDLSAEVLAAIGPADAAARDLAAP